MAFGGGPRPWERGFSLGDIEKIVFGSNLLEVGRVPGSVNFAWEVPRQSRSGAVFWRWATPLEPWILLEGIKKIVLGTCFPGLDRVPGSADCAWEVSRGSRD